MGVAEPGPLVEGPAFQAWLAEGRHGEMAWLADRPERRADPAAYFPAVRSVVSLGMNYAFEPGGAAGSTAEVPAGAAAGARVAAALPAGLVPPDGASPTPRGRIARYARGADYHNLLGKRLRALLMELRRTVPGLDGRWAVDTAPVMDRAWAVRGGLGWWGKHTNVVSTRHGSWLLLGTLFLDRPLPPDPPGRDHCGSCRRCLDVCPTQAFPAPHVLDARRCISYLTIEHRGAIPRELRPAVGDWIFGCDLCLEVCPWNRFATESREARLRAREDRDAPALLPLLNIDDAAFKVRFNGSPIQRTRREGLVRNVAVALGNVGGAESVGPLQRAAAADVSPLVREHAAWALEQLARRGVEVGR